VSELPSGTVSLLFSDIEGSTALLRRLGPAYADALDGQRQVLRRAWADHGGTELGTEGDSFFVAFPTAEGAVKAAAQAQWELHTFDWPAGEQVRVRMGIHTGTPVIHEGGYVGMDVHRAARIAGAAHGGQVVISSATAELVGGCLPDRVGLRDLGSHQLKDLPQVEHLFQLVIDALQAEFPPLKTLGAASSLPRPATPLVGRDGEVAGLTALLGSPEVRLVTLTGPGGAGKTRIAIALAQQLVERFPDGVFFVQLSAVTTSDVMWTSIAEVLDVPPKGRIRPGLFDHVAHRIALFVLDNLEQVQGADIVVAELLEHAPQAVVVATSRRPMNVPGELQHVVPPLELPESPTLEEVERAGAVQLFMQHARAVKATFALNAANAADVAAVCARLDGLPLAIELAAARTKLLSPGALLTRLDRALDITATGSLGPSRQRTLRDTIAWSYDLLAPTPQEFFRRMGVFAGGADLDAIATVTGDILGEADPLDLIATLVDASLVTIAEDAHGEPRVGMLEIIRAYARDQLLHIDELDQVALAHVEHYLGVVQALRTQAISGRIHQELAARGRFEAEHDNVREALDWAFGPDGSPPPERGRVQLGLRLCVNMAAFWSRSGYLAEARRRLERAVSVAADEDDVELSRCLTDLSTVAITQGDAEQANVQATRAVAMCRRLGHKRSLSYALNALAASQHELGESDHARAAFEEAAALAQDLNEPELVARVLRNLAIMEAREGNLERSLELDTTVLRIEQQRGNERGVLIQRENTACTMRIMGKVDDAHQQMREVIPDAIRLADPDMLMALAEDYAAVLAGLGHHQTSARLLGAADAMREHHGTLRLPQQEAEIAEPLTKARTALGADAWQREYHHGRNTTVEDALTHAHAETGGSSR
jgi:predicted ATPase/class 3 adenylate cyclase